jgi:phospholipid-transporting ATPase
LGACNIETTNLDGETNLKARQAVQFEDETLNASKPYTLEGQVEIDPPNVQLYVFKGNLSLSKSGSKPIGLDNQNVILRTCSLRNTPYVYGLVVYTGHETKIMMNSSSSPFKTTKLEELLNVFVFIAFGIQIVFCIFCMISYGIFSQRTKMHSYLRFDLENIPLRTVLIFFTSIILFQVCTELMLICYCLFADSYSNFSLCNVGSGKIRSGSFH